MAAIKTLTIEALSAEINVNAKTIRKVLRANVAKENQPGRGGRWVIKSSDIEKVRALCESHTAKSATVATFED